MMGKVVGGIRVKPTQLVKAKTGLTDAQFDKALLSIADGKFTAEKLKADFLLTNEQLGRL